jgi:hypothetical protein
LEIGQFDAVLAETWHQAGSLGYNIAAARDMMAIEVDFGVILFWGGGTSSSVLSS